MADKHIVYAKIRQPSGHFPHATTAAARGRLVFISGMTARRADGTIAGIGDIEAQTRQVCENIKAAVEAAGGRMDHICRVDVYIRNMEQFDAIHRVRREYFKEPLPASTMVEIVKMTHPDYLIEINAIAVIPDSERLSSANNPNLAEPNLRPGKSRDPPVSRLGRGKMDP